MDETTPQPANQYPEKEPATEKKEAKGKSRPILSGVRKYWWVILFPLFTFIVVGISALSGYRSGLEERQNNEVEQEALTLLEQFNLGVEDLTAGRYDLAKQRA
jgi:hypothetical protein